MQSPDLLLSLQLCSSDTLTHYLCRNPLRLAHRITGEKKNNTDKKAEGKRYKRASEREKERKREDLSLAVYLYLLKLRKKRKFSWTFS